MAGVFGRHRLVAATVLAAIVCLGTLWGVARAELYLHTSIVRRDPQRLPDRSRYRVYTSRSPVDLSGSVPLPQPKPFRIRLFHDVRLYQLQVTGQSRLRLDGRTVRGPVRLGVYGNRLWISDRMGNRAAGRMELGTSGEVPLRLEGPHAQSRSVIGEVTVRASGGRLLVYARMSDNAYLSGILEPELGTLDQPDELLKAQIVASRSYFLAMRGRHGAEGFDFCDTAHCQVFRAARSTSSLNKVLAGVAGQVVTLDRRVIPAFFHHSCGGGVSAPENFWAMRPRPYLQSLSGSAYENYCRLAGEQRWRVTLHRELVETILRKARVIGRSEHLVRLKVSSADKVGRARRIAVRTTARVRILSAGRLRQLVNRTLGGEKMRSQMFTIAPRGSRVVFRGSGWGHGIGLCQVGAKRMALDRKSYREILAHYFPGTQILKL